MNAQRWRQFLAFIERARTKPAFDAEEREHRLQIAGELRAALAGSSDTTLGELEKVFARPLAAGGYELTNRPETGWLTAWARAPGKSLLPILHRFPDSASDAVGRFEYFVGAAQEAGTATSATALMAAGSLLNFAYDTESLPVVRSEPFDRIEATLGFEVQGGAALHEQYARHLAFARAALARMQEAGIAARDMVDAGGLIALAADDEELWASGFGRWGSAPLSPGGGAAQGRSPRLPLPSPREGAPYLSVCAIYRDEAQNLREWIEFHRLVGVERFFLYNNGSTDDHQEVLAPFVEDGTVVLHEWPVFPGRWPVLNPQRAAYDDCLRWHRRDSRWIAFIDIDEFLFSPTGAPVTEVLTEYESWPAVVVNWATFYFCGHQVRPDGLLTENYRRRVNVPTNRQVKSIVAPAATIRSLTVHHFLYAWLGAVDENLYPERGFATKSISFSRLRLNHYFTKSEAEFAQKSTRPDAGGAARREATGDMLASLRELEETAGEPDEAILSYLPALRGAMG